MDGGGIKIKSKTTVCSLALLLFLFLAFSLIVKAQPSIGPTLISPADNKYTNDNTPFFKWENIATENITHYRLVVDNSMSFDDGDNFYDNWELIDNWDDFNTHIENAFPEGTWYWKIQAENAEGWGPFSETRYFHVDVTPPYITMITVSDNLIAENDVGGAGTFQVNVYFNENMKSNMPGLNFQPNVEQDTLTIYSAGWMSNTRYRVTFTVNDANVENDNIDVLVSQGAEDLAGNDFIFNWPTNAWRENDLFSVDTKKPTPTFIKVSHPTIADDNVGQKFHITIGFDEEMDYTRAAMPNFNPFVMYTTLSGIGIQSSWDDNHYWYYENYTIADANESYDNIDIESWNMKDLAGNTQNILWENDIFSVDTLNPTAVSAAASHPIINSLVAGQTFTVTVIYDDNMNTTIAPDIEFFPSVTSTLTPGVGSWSNSLTFVKSYAISDANVNITGIDILVENGKDDLNNLQASLLNSDNFGIDTVSPTVQLMVVSDNFITGADLSGTFTVTILYDQPMNQTVNPNIEFSPSVVTTLTPGAGSWSSSSSFSQNYTVIDGNVNVFGVDILVENARDENNNIQENLQDNNKFDVDTKGPQIVSVTVSDNLVLENDMLGPQLKITITFDEDALGDSYSPDLQFYPEVSSTLSLDGIGTGSDNLVWDYTYDISDADVEVFGVSVLIENAMDENNNLMTYYLENALFSIDTRGPSFAAEDNVLIARTRDNLEANRETDLYYYFENDNIHIVAKMSGPGLTVRGNFENFGGGWVTGAAMVENENRYLITHKIENFDNVGGFAIIVVAFDNVGNTTYCSEPFIAVTNINPKENSSLGLNSDNTTDWRTIKDFTAVENLTFEKVGSAPVGRLRFLENLDLCDEITVNALQNLGNNLNIALAKMSLNSAASALAAMNKKTELTMFGLVDFTTSPGILLNGTPVLLSGYTDNAVSGIENLVWDNTLKSLTFRVAGWSTYEADGTAPNPPQGLTASPSSWTTTNSFAISWTNPNGNSEIRGAYYKVGSAPTLDNDGTYVDGSGRTSISGITVGAEGTHTIYVWLVDNAGNKNKDNRSSVAVYFGSPPTTEENEETPTEEVAGSVTPTGGYAITIATITAGSSVNVAVQNVPVTGLEIAVNGTATNVQVTIEESATTPTGIAIASPGTTFGYLDINTQNITDEQINYVKISFKVGKAAMSATDKTSISLYRYTNGEWVQLPTQIISEDGTYVYYEAVSPGLSVFVISTSTPITTIVTTTTTTPAPQPTPTPTAGGSSPDWLLPLIIIGGAAAIAIALVETVMHKRKAK